METHKYTCIICGNYVDALFRQYGPTVLKVSNCDRCGSVADKYIEYDPVIVMVDIVLLSKQAYRHVLYNTPFKVYWKLLIVLILMETYVDWSQELALQKYVQNSTLEYEYESKSFSEEVCKQDKNEHNHLSDGKNTMERNDNKCVSKFSNINRNNTDDPFLIEKGIYLTFCCVSFGMLIYIAAAFVTSIFFRLFSIRENEVEFILLLKGMTLGGMGNLLMIPSLIWGGDHDTSVHSFLVCGYTMLALTSIHSVIFECSKWKSLLILTISAIFKHTSSSYLKAFSNSFI